jgi:hypothetical protein
MDEGEGNFTSVIVVRHDDLDLFYAQSPGDEVVSEVVVVLRVIITPRSALIIFPSLDVETSVVAGNLPSIKAPLAFANFGSTSSGDSCSSPNTMLSFSIDQIATNGEALEDDWVQLVPDKTDLEWIGTEAKVSLNFTRILTKVSHATRCMCIYIKCDM